MIEPVIVRVKFRSNSVEQFADLYAPDVTHDGIFIRTPNLLSVGTPVRFEFEHRNGGAFLQGNGTVVWVRGDNSIVSGETGMGVRFDILQDDSKHILNQVLNQKARLQTGTPARQVTAPTHGDNLDGEDEPPTNVSDASEQLLDQLAVDELGRPIEASGLPAGKQAWDAIVPLAQDDVTRDLVSPRIAASLPANNASEYQADAESFTNADTIEESRSQALERILFESEKESDQASASGIAGARPLSNELGATGSEVIQPASGGQISAKSHPEAGISSIRSGGSWLAILGVFVAAGLAAYVFLRQTQTEDPQSTTQAQDTSAKTSRISMFVTSTPSGAKISVDGKDTEKVTPARIDDLDPTQAASFRFDLPGRKPVTVEKTPSDSEPLNVLLTEKSRRILKLESEPSGATVYVDDEKIGVTPYESTKTFDELKPHQIKFRYDGYEDFEQALELKTATWVRTGDDEVLTITAKLKASKSSSAAKRAAYRKARRRWRRRRYPSPPRPPKPASEGASGNAVASPDNTAAPAKKPATSGGAGGQIKIPTWGQ